MLNSMKINYNNKQVKQLLIEFYGEEICFTYPKDKSKPQMFFCRLYVKLTLFKRYVLKTL